MSIEPDLIQGLELTINNAEMAARDMANTMKRTENISDKPALNLCTENVRKICLKRSLA